jgi:hypothetical protein
MNHKQIHQVALMDALIRFPPIPIENIPHESDIQDSESALTWIKLFEAQHGMYDTIRLWIQANISTPPQDNLTDHAIKFGPMLFGLKGPLQGLPLYEELEEAVKWFFCCQEAQGIRDSWNLKDYADAIAKGSFPDFSKHSQLLETAAEFGKMIEEDDFSWAEVLEDLTEHFGV